MISYEISTDYTETGAYNQSLAERVAEECPEPPALVAARGDLELATLITAANIAGAVKSSLRYEPDSKLENIETSQESTCTGYTIAGSECLDIAGIDHRVAFVNGHSTILLPIDTPEGSSVWLMDMLSPKLNQEIKSSLVFNHEESIDDEKSSAIIDTSAIANNVDTYDCQSALHKYPWLSLNGNREAAYPSRREESRNELRLLMSVFKPELGRTIIGAYARFNDAVDGGNTREASQEILAMHGNFPDIDIRGKAPREVKKLVKRLCIAGDSQQAEQVTGAFFDSFSASQDTRVTEYRADCLRKISELAGKPTIAKQALRLYDKVIDHPKAYASVKAKKEMCEVLAEAA